MIHVWIRARPSLWREGLQSPLFVQGTKQVFRMLGKGGSEDEFHCFEAVVLQNGQDIVLVSARVLFLDSGDQAGYMAEGLV